MRIYIETQVCNTVINIADKFNEDLFKKLSPPLPPVKVVRFDGCKTGNLVCLELNFLLFKQKWVSEITAHTENRSLFTFTDIGTQLPFFLKKWQHIHAVKALNESKSWVIDDIDFSTGYLLADVFIYPLMWLQFAYRIPIYKRYLSKQ